MSVSDYWYSHDIPSVKIESQVFAPDLINAIKELTGEIRELRKLMEKEKQ